MIAITEPTKEYGWMPSCNPLVYTIKTDNPSARLSYYVDISIDCGAGSVHTQMKYPVYNRAALSIDLSSIVNEYLEDTFCNDDLVTYQGGAYSGTYQKNEVARIVITITEEYYNSVQQQMVIDTANAQTSKIIYVWRAAAQFEDSRNLMDFNTKFRPVPGVKDRGKFLGPQVDPLESVDAFAATWPQGNPEFFKNAYEVSFNTHRTLSYFNLYEYWPAPNDFWNKVATDVYVWTFNENLTVIKEMQIIAGVPLYTPESEYWRMINQIQCGLGDLNNLPSSSYNWNYMASGYSNYFTPDEDKYYLISVNNAWETQGGYGIRAVPFKVVECDKYKVYNILYKTTEGGWWQIRANMKHYNETSVKTNLKYNNWGLSAQEVLPNNKRFKQTMHTDANGTITLNTDWIDCNEKVREIEDMIISPQIYLVTEDLVPQYIPVILKDKTHKILDKGQDKMFQYEFEFEEAFTKNTLV